MPPPTDVVSAMDTEIDHVTSRHTISVSIGAEVRKILRRLVHFEHPRHDEDVGMLVRSVGCHKLPAGVWGEAPAANGFLAQ